MTNTHVQDHMHKSLVRGHRILAVARMNALNAHLSELRGILKTHLATSHEFCVHLKVAHAIANIFENSLLTGLNADSNGWNEK